MQLEGTYTFNASLEEVWQALMDPEVLALALPGGEALEQVGESEYKAVMNMRVGPVQGRFEGGIELTDINPMHSYRMKVSGQGAPGFVNGEGALELSPNGEAGVLLAYRGDVQVGGKIAGVSQRLVESTARSVIKQGLAALERQILAGADGVIEEEITMARKKSQDAGAAAGPDAAEAHDVPAGTQLDEAATVPTDVDELVVDAEPSLPSAKLEAADMVAEGAPIYPQRKLAAEAAVTPDPTSREHYFMEQQAAAGADVPWKPLAERTADRPLEARATGARPSAVPQAARGSQTSKGEFAGNVMRDVARDLASDYIPLSQQDKFLYAALGAAAAFLFVALVRLVQKR